MGGKVSANLPLFILGILYSSVQANPTFVSEPTDYTQIFSHGSSHSLTVTFRCTVQKLQTGQSVAWYKNGLPISNNGTVYSNYVDTSRYTVDMSTSVQQSFASFHLKIETSATSADTDSGNYQCVVITVPNVESRTARLDVYVTPQSGYLRCAIGADPNDDVFNVLAGTPISLQCRSDPTGVPAMTTHWSREGYPGETFGMNTGTDTRDGSLTLSFFWTPTNQQNNAVFICTGFHPVYTINVTCQLGPFNVQYKPIVQISPSSYKITMETQVVTFTCIADANPPVTRYIWGNTAGKKFSQQSDNVIIGSDRTWIQMINFESQDNGVYYVTCYAENNIGRSVTVIATLNIIIQPNTGTIATTYTPTEREIFSDLRTLPQVSWNPILTEDATDIHSVSKTMSPDKMASCCPCRNNTSTTVAVLSATVAILSLVIIFGITVFAYCFIEVRRKGQIPFTKYSVHKVCNTDHSRQADQSFRNTNMLNVQTPDTTSMTPICQDPTKSVLYDEISRDEHGTEHYQSLNPTPKDVYTSLNDVKVVEKGE
ncbi:kin of IRRE-like protein 3 [Ptychodera flava]|uniref:kin of IRRE-like protein 3 n=1 Tax=Ptychodera flava TaxID=63121 RepID=UPI00396A8090